MLLHATILSSPEGSCDYYKYIVCNFIACTASSSISAYIWSCKNANCIYWSIRHSLNYPCGFVVKFTMLLSSSYSHRSVTPGSSYFTEGNWMLENTEQLQYLISTQIVHHRISLMSSTCMLVPLLHMANFGCNCNTNIHLPAVLVDQNVGLVEFYLWI